MTDPTRRDPTEFLRVLRRMSNTTSWQKALIFASKGRMVGYRLTLEHYNTILYSQSMWGRALEMIKVIRAMQQDGVQPNGASYYYIVNGMANADHGYNYDFNINSRLEKLQHWRVALNALQTCEANGFDTTDTMHNSVIVTMTIPGMNHWQEALRVLQKIVEEDRQLHPNMVRFLHDCLIRNHRPREASDLMRLAAERGVKGYEGAWEADVFKGRPTDAEVEAARLSRAAVANSLSTSSGISDDEVPSGTTAGEKDAARNAAAAATAATLMALQLRGDQALPPAQMREALQKETERNIAAEQRALRPFTAGLHQTEMNSVFRPRVHRQLWYQWHQIANRYRPTASLKRRQLAPRDSPTGIPAWNRL
ncbi:putative mitochondrial hypothetical protein [Leptomonas pyrrhocoris]|uniref:Uncharacterized protein n=1 Tax=Leptomonas pyrrhocoris TaxID=157538 RepID=A0A0N1J4H3_LEPPY|nr:putative mitochondrial hypothetical protein [Leptomonas pyrrhocoris]XP_015655072.1 putative mitochondrial hypothetical protein [Leptomonas pyrrhocoris]KPA76632.1 putative mitochondrial hypothetical protein [Leptomonas pyrrhocoris]KPA76633.1 putative mitochondrial hypothetical protein [Leptomonas pyrrhocoris]|eukprot:XP_015655071.1 putative mitochondrial hypothetical protein [Leptomonas pyrrhocoris]